LDALEIKITISALVASVEFRKQSLKMESLFNAYTADVEAALQETNNNSFWLELKF